MQFSCESVASAGWVCSFFWKEQACEILGCAKHLIRGFHFWLQGVGTEQKGSCVTLGADRNCNKGKSTREEPSLPLGTDVTCPPSPLPAPRAAPSIPSPSNDTQHPCSCQALCCTLELLRQSCNFCHLRIYIPAIWALRGAHLSAGKSQNWESKTWIQVSSWQILGKPLS